MSSETIRRSKPGTVLLYSTDDLTGITDPGGSNFTYEYDSNHNPVKATSAEGKFTRAGYDGKGNIIKMGPAKAEGTGTGVDGVWTNRTFTTDKNHVASVTASTGAVVRYTWDDPMKDLLSSFEDANGHITTYTYDAAHRLAQVSQDVTAGGTAQTASCQYTYTDDRLTSITHNGFQYGFSYDIFGNLKKASAAGTDLVTYTYESPNGNLLKALYADGSYFRYEYDSMDRVKEAYGHTDGASGEAHLYSFVYNRQGELDHVGTAPMTPTARTSAQTSWTGSSWQRRSWPAKTTRR